MTDRVSVTPWVVLRVDATLLKTAAIAPKFPGAMGERQMDRNLQHILSWPIRLIARLLMTIPDYDLDFIHQRYTDRDIWPFRRNVREVVSGGVLTPEGLLVSDGTGPAEFRGRAQRSPSDASEGVNS